MSNAVVDFSTDPGYQTLNKIAVKHTFPAYVLLETSNKLAAGGDRSSCAILAPEPRFPTDGKAACWLSHAYYLQQRDLLSDESRDRVEHFLHKRAAFWDILDDVEQLVHAEVDIIKQAAVTDEKYPLRNEEEIIAAANWLTSAYREQKFAGIKIGERIELAERLLDVDAPIYIDKASTELLWRASCRRGCYDGPKVAAKIDEATKYKTHVPAAKLAGLCRGLFGLAMQTQHKTAALICDKSATFTDVAPELALSINTTEPVYFFPSGDVVKLADFDRFRFKELEMIKRDQLRVGKVANSSVDNLTSTTLNKMQREMDNAGIKFEVRQPRNTRTLASMC